MNIYNTLISANNMAFLDENEKTPGEIIRFLYNGAKFRSFQDVLLQYYRGDDLKERLSKGLTEIMEINAEAIERRVKSWLKGDNLPKNREILYQICFVLGFHEYEASRLLAIFDESGIHYRNPEELIYAYALRTGKTYQEAQKLKEGLLPIYEEESKKAEAEMNTVYTRQIRDEFTNVVTDEELRLFFEKHGKEFGVLHKTAYKKYMELLEMLKNPGGIEGIKEEDYSMDTIVEKYLQLKTPKDKKRKDYTILQKTVKQFWPGTTEMNRMRNQKIDISRKAMMLLFLVTEEFDSQSEEDDGEDWGDIYDNLDDEETLWEGRIQAMNMWLYQFGMNHLDPGSPFDFLMIYAMKPTYSEQEDSSVYSQMEEAMKILFKIEE